MLHFLARSACAVLCALSFLASNSHAGGVRIVDATGARNFADIQSAIDAAVDGDVLLVGAGGYAGFTLDGKSLSILAGPGTVTLSGALSVRNVSGRSIVAGFSAAQSYPSCGVALYVADCSGLVAFESCAFRGSSASGPPAWCSSSRGGEIQNCAAVVFTGCSFEGGWGMYGPGGSTGTPGADGCRMSSSTVAAYETYFHGGKGGSSFNDGGLGGNGLRVVGSWLFGSGCSFSGGDGGDGTDLAASCGPGGDGLVLDSAASAHLLAPAASGGNEGSNCLPTYGPGAAYSGSGSFDFLQGSARRFFTPFRSVDRARWGLTVAGVPGDQVFLNRSLAPVFHYDPSLSGVCTSLLPPFPPMAVLGTVPASGSLAVGVRQRLLPDSVVGQVYYLQGYAVDLAGATVLGSPMYVLSLNWNSLPDCNGNGINDYAEVIAGVTPDLDHDLKPDGCP